MRYVSIPSIRHRLSLWTAYSCLKGPLMERILLRPEEVAQVLGVCRSKAYALISEGHIPSMRIGASVRVPMDRLRAWVDEQMKTREAVTK